jgi:CRISPR-associated protein Csx10
MESYLVTTKSLTPISLRARRDSRYESTLSYIPGSVLWGGLAAAHLRMRPQAEAEFAEFFLSEKIVCGNLYPAQFSLANRATNPLEHDRSAIRPLPRTVRSCKRFGGFQFHANTDDDARHGVWDSLIAWAVFSLSQQTDAAAFDLGDCPICREPFDGFTGFYRRGRTTGQWGAANVAKGIFTRTSISRARGAAAEGMLYSREFLREGNQFCGEWLIDGALPQRFQAFVEETTEDGWRVGHNRTRGLGKLDQLNLSPPTVTDTAVTLKTRAKSFDVALRAKAGAYARHAFYLPVTLMSDCIWPDAACRYRLQLTPAALAEIWGISDAELIYTNADKRRVSGWNGLWGMPKADEWAMAMGSVFLFGLAAEPDWQRLAQAQATGLGVRRTEGFGAIRIADEIHWEANNV